VAAKSKRKAKKPAKTKPPRRAKSAGRKVVKNLADVRANIDSLDAKIVPLLCERLYFVTQAAQFKPSVAGVVVPARVEEIIAKVRAAASARDTSPDTLERVYRAIIDAFTADEQRHWKKLHK
jgi:isochorismate pyruvate lyase